MTPNQNDEFYNPQEDFEKTLKPEGSNNEIYDTSSPGHSTEQLKDGQNPNKPPVDLFATHNPGVDTDKLPKHNPEDLFQTNFPQQNRDFHQHGRDDTNFSELGKGAVIDNKYEILEFIGKGGMSTVFQVRHKELGTILALKVLDKAAWQDPAAANRFKVEAQAIGALTHPCLITYRDFGISSGGQPYLVMDYVEGQDLHDILEEHGKLPLSRVYTMWLQICEGLSLAHRKGIIHRDLKPGNIMFDTTDGGQIKIVDFGVAKIVTEDANQMQALTRTGEVFGSPLYMSPEQCKGLRVDPRSDIYSLGCVIYETITGLHPIAGNSMLDTLTNHVEKLHPPPLQIDPSLAGVDRSGWVPPEDFQYILLKCLQKNPKDRYQNVDEIIEDLKKLKDNTLVKQDLPKATVNSLRQQATLEPRTSPKEMIGMIATIIFICIALGGAGAGAWYFLMADKPEKVASKDASSDRDKEKEPEAPSINPVADNSMESKDAEEILHHAKIYIEDGKYDLATNMVESAIALRIANGAPPTMLAENYRQLANCYAKQSNPDYNKAFANYNKSIDIYKNLPLGSGAPMQKVVMLDYAKALEDFGQAAQAKDMREKANSLQQM